MNKHFEIADKVVNGEKLTRFDEQTGTAVVVKWDIAESDIPKVEARKKYVEIKVAEDVVVPSIWKGFMSAANTGINNFANKLNSLFSSEPSNYQANKDYEDSFRATVVHTGIRAIMSENEILNLYSANTTNCILMAGGTQLCTDDREITISVYNVFPKDMLLKKGQTIAFGVFQKVEGIEAQNIDLSK